jgi:hypothetical protein
MTTRRWALITGAGKRLGRGVAMDLAAHGWGVAAHFNRSAADAQSLVEDIRTAGGAAVAVGADLGDPAAAEGLVPAAAAAAGATLTALVNCASLFEHDDIDTFNAASFMQHMCVNAFAPVALMQAFARALDAEARGAVVNFLDFKLATPYPDHLSYSMSKYALAGATEMLARALAPQVRVNAVAPGYILPSPGQAQADFERLHAQTPLARGADVADITGAVRYLLESPAITGQTIFVDAGLRFRSFERDLAFL